jgi:hypothetical protein
MPRPKSYGDFYITGKDNVLPVFISTNTVQGRNKYILDLKSLIDSNDIGADELLKIRRKISINGNVLSCYINKNQTLEVVLLRGVDWKSQSSGISTGDEIKQIIQGEVTAKIQQSTSTTTPTTTSPPAMKLTRDWQAYYVMPRTGIQIFQDQNAPNKNLFLFYIPEFPYGRDVIKGDVIQRFLSVLSYLGGFQGGSYHYAEKLNFLPSQDSFAIEFSIGGNAQSVLNDPLPSLDTQEDIFKKIDNTLIRVLNLADFSATNPPAPKYTLDDIKALQRGDLVKINNGKEFNIELTIKRDEKKGVSDGKLADMRDINDGTFHVDIFYPIGWFKSYIDDPDYTVEIIKAVAKDDTVNIPSILSVAEEDLQRAKKELSQLLMLKSFTSSVEFERKIEINQKISEVQKRINDLNFKILERKMSKDDIFEDLFEQSFTPINNTYTEVFAPSSDGSGEGVSADFFAPDGSPSKLSDSLNELIRTPQFLEWFGNWQLAYAYKDTDAVDISCSKVVTKDYEPLVVWHGTGQQFSYFRFDNFPAAYFAVNWRYSKWFADLHGGGNGYTIPFFLNIRNPLDLTRFETRKIKAKEFFDYIYLMTGMTMVDLEVNPLFMDTNAPAVEPWVYLRNNAKMLKKLSENHVFDGIHFYETNPNVPVGESANRTEAFITFTAEQCKVADPNRGLLLFASLKSFLLKKGGKI